MRFIDPDGMLEENHYYDEDGNKLGEDENIDYHREVTSIFIHEGDHKRDHDEGTYQNKPLSEIRVVNEKTKDPLYNCFINHHYFKVYLLGYHHPCELAHRLKY